MERENAATHPSFHCWVDMVEQEAGSLKEVQRFEYYPVVCLCVCVKYSEDLLLSLRVTSKVLKTSDKQWVKKKKKQPWSVFEQVDICCRLLWENEFLTDDVL